MCYDGPDGPKTILCWQLSEDPGDIESPDGAYTGESLEEHIQRLISTKSKDESSALVNMCYDLDGNPRSSGIVY